MSVEAGRQTGELESAAITAARESMRKNSGPIDRAVELFVVLAWPFSALYLFYGGSDWMMYSVMNATLLVVSLIGGILTNVPPKNRPAPTK